MKAWVVPMAMLAASGVITIETSSAGVMVRAVEPETVPELALIVATPVPALVAMPALLIAAVTGVSEAQVTMAVMSLLVPSVNQPVAVNACEVPKAIEGLAGAVAIETKAAAVTVSVVVPLIVPDVAVIAAAPVATLVARPCVPRSLLMLAVAGVSEVQPTVWVRSCVLPSVKVPVAVNCWVTPSGMTGMAGVSAIDTNTAGVTSKVAEPVTPSEVALTPLLPTAVLLTTP